MCNDVPSPAENAARRFALWVRVNRPPSCATRGVAGGTGPRDQGASTMNGLERVFPIGHRYHYRLFYDPREGSYYDKSTDMFITLQEAATFGLPV